jgi:hypothetical protein
MNLKEEILHHIFPGLSSFGAAFSLGEHFAFSVGVGVAVYCITHAISFGVKALIKKFGGKCDKD